MAQPQTLLREHVSLPRSIPAVTTAFLALLASPRGSSGLASYTGGGVRVLGWTPVRALSLGGDVDVWSQPPVLPAVPYGLGGLGASRTPTNDSPGASFGVYARLAVLGKIGVTGKLAYKTSGYLMGEPVGEGLYGYAGISVEP